MLKIMAAAAVGLAGLSLAACDGSAERAGERLDNQIEETTQGERDLGDGAFERAGEAIDNAGGTERTDSGADALSDATDGNPDTRP
ncbi:MAG: hypothetical protein JNK94_04465 [Hyphomonadaceae bacterium]|nr:hypothetical protein [Hyphomonadaceae bacterium]MBX3510980.1 hypothetical protein [Hyphomonadaceae bacterium]